MSKIIITGSMGLIGTEVTRYLKQNYDVLELDLQLGNDLADELFVREWFKNNRGDFLVNLFALNDPVTKDRNSEFSDLFNITLDSFRKYMELNLVCLFSVCREFARNNTFGGIVNFSSNNGLVSPLPEMYPKNKKHIAYGISKAGVIQMTRYLAVHLAPKIRVNCIAPGGVLKDQPEEFVEEYGIHTPLKRMMNVNEINGLVEYLCSDKSSYVTGSTFVIDGGWTSQ